MRRWRGPTRNDWLSNCRDWNKGRRSLLFLDPGPNKKIFPQCAHTKGDLPGVLMLAQMWTTL